ncbi:MAG: hypothetical protein Q8P57_03310 [Candidatus Pacearchaeota archaeon]|nr:hypothetical protein [Candidatus Pacearchaeota archaeon]
MKKRNSFVLFVLIVIVGISFLGLYFSLKVYSESKSFLTAQAIESGVLSLTVEGTDLTIPLISITSPESTTYTSHRTEITYAVSDNALNSCWYSLNQGVTNTTITCGSNVTGITSSEGSNTWAVYANDTNANENSSLVTFTISLPAGGGEAAGGGGGGGGASYKKRNFNVIPSEVSVDIVSGVTDMREIRVYNNGDFDLDINVSVTGIKGFVGINKNEIHLKKGDGEQLFLTIGVSAPGIYPGKIIFTSGNLKKEVALLINVISEDTLFDVSVTIPERFKVINLGEDLPVFVELTEIGGDGVDAELKYIVKDFNGKTLFSETEERFVRDYESFNKIYSVKDLPAGDYVAGVELSYSGGFASSSAQFRITETSISLLTYIALIVLLIVIIIVVILIRHYNKKKSERGKMLKKAISNNKRGRK